MQACLALARISNFTACLARFKLAHHVSVGTCRRLLGLMASASPVLPLGLLHMRPFLWWMKELRLHPTVPATRLIRVSRSCSRPLLLWRDPAFLQSGVRMGAIHYRHMITTDASLTGWGAVFEGRPASGNGQKSSGSTMQSKGEQFPSHSPILALPDLVFGANSPLVSVPLRDSDQAGLAVPASGQDLASSTRALEVVGMAHTGPRAVMDILPVKVQETIASARAPATRKLYTSMWGVFESWCLARAIDPVNCPVGPVLEFLQERLTAGAAENPPSYWCVLVLAAAGLPHRNRGFRWLMRRGTFLHLLVFGRILLGA